MNSKGTVITIGVVAQAGSFHAAMRAGRMALPMIVTYTD